MKASLFAAPLAAAIASAALSITAIANSPFAKAPRRAVAERCTCRPLRNLARICAGRPTRPVSHPAADDQPRRYRIEQTIYSVTPGPASRTVCGQEHRAKQHQKFDEQAEPPPKQVVEPRHLAKQGVIALKHSLVHREIADAEQEYHRNSYGHAARYTKVQ